MTKLVLVSFPIGRYKDEMLCDMVLKQVGPLLLGRLWQFDRRIIHDGYKNRYTLEKDDKRFTLGPLTP